MLNLTYLPMLCIFRTIVVLLSQGRFLGGIAHPLEVTLSGSQVFLDCSPCSHWRILMKLTQNMYLDNILSLSKGQGHRSKGQRSKMRSNLGIFGLKKLGLHRSEFGSTILDLGPLNKYKKKHRK